VCPCVEKSRLGPAQVGKNSAPSRGKEGWEHFISNGKCPVKVRGKRVIQRPVEKSMRESSVKSEDKEAGGKRPFGKL